MVTDILQHVITSILRGLCKSIKYFTGIKGISVWGVLRKIEILRMGGVNELIHSIHCCNFLQTSNTKNSFLSPDGYFLLFARWKAKLNLTKRERGEREREKWRERERAGGLDWFTPCIGKYEHVIYVTNPCRCRPAKKKILWLFIEGSFP